MAYTDVPLIGTSISLLKKELILVRPIAIKKRIPLIALLITLTADLHAVASDMYSIPSTSLKDCKYLNLPILRLILSIRLKG